MYTIFTRTWWKINTSTKRLEPKAGRRTHHAYASTIDEARSICTEYNNQERIKSNKLGLKAEFTKE